MHSLVARCALGIAVLAVVGTLLGPLGARLGLLPPFIGFATFGLSLLFGGALALACGLLGLWRTRARSGRTGRGQALLGSAVGALLLLTGFALGSRSADVPPIHDITTTPERPPAFGELARHPDNVGRDLAYPHGGAEVPALQREAYPELAPIELPVDAAGAFEAVVATVAELGWEVASQDPGTRHLEASDRTGIFRFVDDVAIDVEPTAAGSVVHVRSTSRIGQSDLGANAARIERFAEALRARF